MSQPQFDSAAHQELASASLAWEFMPIDRRQEFAIAAMIPSTEWNRWIRREWSFVPYQSRLQLLQVFQDWNAELRALRTAQWSGAVAEPHPAVCATCCLPITADPALRFRARR